MKRNYNIVRIGPDNILDLIPLYKGVFGIAVSAQFINAKYDTHYLGKAYYGHLAYDESGVPVAYYGAVPFAITINGKKVIAAQSGDAMTMKGHSGQGLFTRLGEATDELLKQEGIAFVYGFPNQNSHHGYTKKLHWQHREKMQRYTISVSTLPIEAISRAIPILRKAYEWWTQMILPQSTSDHLSNSVVDQRHGGTARDKSFFDYKLFLKSRLSRVGGQLVWLKAQGGLLIGDIELGNEEQLEACLKAIKRKARWLGTPQITFQVSPGAPLDQFFAARYPAHESWAIGYKDYGSGLPLEQLRFTYGDLDTF